MVKRIRVHGGCLGAARRRRTRSAAKSRGEEPISRDPRVSEWGNPPVWMTGIHARTHTAWRSTPGTEPSQYRQEEKSKEIPPVAASERGGAQTACVPSVGALRARCCKSCSEGVRPPSRSEKARGGRNCLGRPAEEGESPVRGSHGPAWDRILSTAGHEESCRKQGGPPSKAKYSAATDSA